MIILEKMTTDLKRGALNHPRSEMESCQTPVSTASPGRERPSVRSTAKRTASRRRYTPYHKTPGNRPIGATERAYPRTPTEDPEEPTCFSGLMCSTWRTYKMTPLYDFKTTAPILKKYGRLLSAFIEAERRKGNAVDVEGESPDKVDISLYKGLQVSQDDPVAIQILMRAQNEYGNGEMKTVLTSYLLGVEIEVAMEPNLKGEFIHYPVLLVKGAIGLTRLLGEWMRSQFDCSMSPLTFSSLDLTWVSAMWSGQLSGGTNKPVELMYSLPSTCEGLNKITLTINPEDCKEVWDCIHDKNYQDVSREEVTAYITCLENHFYHHFKIKLSGYTSKNLRQLLTKVFSEGEHLHLTTIKASQAMHLTRVGTALAYIGSEGKLKLFSEDNVLPILRHITCLAVEQLGKYQQ